MADTAIFGLGQETALTAAHRLVVQETSAATLSQSATFALMGGLEHNAQTVTTADITGAVGQFYYCTIAGLTAARNLTLPASPNVGERIGVYIVDGDASFELILKGAATVTINGGSAATEWSRLFIANECVIFRATSSTNWVVEYDGRIPSSARIDCTSGSNQSISDITWTQVTCFTTNVRDRGGIADQANDRVVARRDNTYIISVNGILSPSVTGDFRCACCDQTGTSNFLLLSPKGYGSLTQLSATATAGVEVDVSASTELRLYVRQDTSAARDLLADFGTYLDVVEIL